MSRTIVVIGGAGGGPVAAARARELDEHARIVLVEQKPHVSWVQAGLRHHLEGQVTRLAELDEDRRQFFADRHRIELRTGTEAVRLDPDSHRLVVRTSAGSETLRYDAAIFSGGVEVSPTGVPDLALGERGVIGFRTADDLKAIRAAQVAGARTAVVIGCGPYGVDAAVGLKKAGLEVHVVERNRRILPSLSLLAARAAQRALAASGVTLHLGARIETAALQADGRRRIGLAGGAVVDADLVVITTGLRPRTGLLSDAGASLNADGSVRVNAKMETTLPHVYACGSAVSVTHAVTRAPLWLPQAAIATRTAQIAGHNAVVDGVKETLSPLAGTALYSVGDGRFARTGLSEAEARSFLGEDRVFAVSIHGYAGEPWIGGESLCVRLVVDRKKSVVVGGEVWGGSDRAGVPRRIDLLAAAVADGWSPERIADLDMAYVPTLGPAFDPLQAAGQIAAQTLAGEANPIGAEALAARVAAGDVVIIDVSRPGRPGPWPQTALRVPLEALRERLGEIPRDRAIVAVSQTGQRAYQAYRLLRQRGFTQCSHLDGGGLSYSLTLDN
jgi:NADPH-dependent 2,4-dienoyl-CoA reductase/sulfur reductase-like enzyme/rhodanese-related sulfurtransferase